MYYFLYNLILVIYVLIMLPVVGIRYITQAAYRARIRKTLWRKEIPLDHYQKTIWLHAASVGEVVAADPIVKELKKREEKINIVLTVLTPAGYEMACRTLPMLDYISYFPFDLKFLLQRAIRRIQPNLIVLVETELWPNFLRLAKTEDVPVVIVNGRLSSKSEQRYRKIQGFMQKAVESVVAFCMQSQTDVNRLQKLGISDKKIKITGNTKYDQADTFLTEVEKERWHYLLHLADDSILIVAGSTHKGEEEMVLYAFKQLLTQGFKVQLLLAPRALHRLSEVRTLLTKEELDFVVRTDLPAQDNTPVVLLDTIGELGDLYGLADIVFVGGSLVEVGGHNILEPAGHGKAIVTGSHMFNFSDIFQHFQENKACLVAHDKDELLRLLANLANSAELRKKLGQAAYQVIKENRGAAVKNVEEIQFWLEKSHRS